MRRAWTWLAGLLEERWFGQPRSDTAAITTRDEAANLRAPDGSTTRFVGRALEWDCSKSSIVGLEFEAPWFTRREIEVFAWASADATIELESSALSPGQVRTELTPGTFRSMRLAVLADEPKQGDTFRVVFSVAGASAYQGKIHFGLGVPGSAHATCIRARLVLSGAFGIYLATWFNLACLLFVLAAGFGLRASGALGTLLVLVPNILEKLGAQWASQFRPSAVAQWIRNRMRGLVPLWLVLSVPLGAVVAYMVAAFAVFAIYEWRLDKQLSDPSLPAERRAEFFCAYPYRMEARVLLAKHLEIRSAEQPLIKGYQDATKAVSKRRFLDECLSPARPLGWLVDNARTNETNARILYASLLWNISTREEFLSRPEEIKDVLGGVEADRLGNITLAKYELKAIKNHNEQVACKDVRSQACLAGRSRCLATRTRLGALLDDRSIPKHELASISVLEGYDAAASSHLSIGCSYGTLADTNAAIGHYFKLIGNLPRGPTLEQPLTQINFRKFIDSKLEVELEHPTARLWKEECATFLRESCDRIEQVFIKDRRQKFFEASTEDRLKSWGGASITYLEGEDFRKFIWDARTKGWRWPL